MWEAIQSLHVLQQADLAWLHEPWFTETRHQFEANPARPALELLLRLTRSAQDIPAFLTPFHVLPTTDLDADLKHLRTTPASVVRQQLVRLEGTRSSMGSLRALMDAPQQQLPHLARAIKDYWALALAPRWTSIQEWLRAEIRARRKTLDSSGIAACLHTLHPDLSIEQGHLVDHRTHRRLGWTVVQRWIIVPFVFGWPVAHFWCDGAGRAVVMYPLQRSMRPSPSTAAPESVRALEELLDEPTVHVLLALDIAGTPEDLSRWLERPAGTLLGPLFRLLHLELVERRVVGDRVYYCRSSRGQALLRVYGAAPERVEYVHH
jgi:hypothetical protein